MNIYEKIQLIKLKIAESSLKKSGENKFAKYSYYELCDFLPTIIKLCDEHKICTIVSFDNETAKMIVVNSEEPEEKLEITSPMRDLELKGCNAIQTLGGVETYQRRYLYMAMFDIVENDMFDGKEIKEYKCTDCGKDFEPFTDKNGKTWNAGQVFHLAENSAKKQGITDGKARCSNCLNKLKGEVNG